MSAGLLPDAAPIGPAPLDVDRPIPLCARKWGRIIDTSNLLPGDLLLTRTVKPDYVSKEIVQAQTNGGLPDRHAQWTHAVVYLGDGEHICESSFKERGYKWGVNIRSVFEYCNGEFAIRARRPAGLSQQQRIGMAIGAMASVGKGYNFREIFAFKRAAKSGKGFWHGTVRQSIDPNALICSTLYQDALTFAFKGISVKLGVLCTPAHLSASTDFDTNDPPIGWLSIR